MTNDHLRHREALGAYVIDALDTAERQEVEAHLATCASCSDELARLAGMPGLLGRLTADEAAAGMLTPRPAGAEQLVARIARARARERRRLLRWRAGAALAAVVSAVAVVALVVFAMPGSAPDRIVAAAVPAAAEAEATEGTAAALAWEWGTTVEIDLVALPPRDHYQLVAVASDGRRQQAGTWGRTDTASARVRGASAILRHDLARVEVTDDTGRVLVTFEF